jgi:uncharacterized protein (DUF433 family)
MSLEGTVHNGVIGLDPGGYPLAEGTRVEVAPRTGMEPLINKTPGVCGGRARIGNHRIAVWGLVEMRQNGATDAHLREAYPHVDPKLFDAAWQYAEAHPNEIAFDIRENEEA